MRAATTSQTLFADHSRDPRRVHVEAIKNGLSPTPQTIAVFNNLITLYSNSNLNSSSLQLFLSIPCPNTATWTSIISAFSSSPTAIALFQSMLRHPRRALPNTRTFATLLKTCASSTLFLGPQLHSLSFKLASYENTFVGSALVSLYCKTSDMNAAQKVFDEMPERDEACFAAIINGLARNNRPVDSLRYFVEMRRQDVDSTFHSVSGALRAASTAAMLEQCRIIHGHALINGMDSETYVETALMDGYGKCGLVEDVRKLFNLLEVDQNIASWNTILAAYAQQGNQETVLQLFISLESRGIKPDHYTFLAILTAFSNASMASETETWLKSMKSRYGLEPHIQHYTCLVGALGRAGRLEEAEKLVLSMPYEPDAAIWRVLLSSCCGGNPDLASRISKKLRDINPHDDSAYVILANALSRAGRWEEVKQVWKMMRDMGVRKEVGRSWIEVKGSIHVFFSGDRRHSRVNEVYAKLAELKLKIERLGYLSIVDEIPYEVDVEDKKEMTWYHSEKLAVAFGLLKGVTPPGKPLRVVKNLRICRDCHEVFKYISRVEKREILMRDAHRYHRFLDGGCSCYESW